MPTPRTPLTPAPESAPPPAPEAPPVRPAPAGPEKKSPHAWALQKYGQDSPKGRRLTPKGAFCQAGVLHLRHWIEDDQITQADFDAAEAEFMAQKIER